MNYQPSIPQRTVYGEDIVSAGRKRGLADKMKSIRLENNNTTKQLRKLLLTRKTARGLSQRAFVGEFRVNDETNCVRDATK